MGSPRISTAVPNSSAIRALIFAACAHGRVLQAYLTERGEELLSRAHALVEAVEERMLPELGEDERPKLAETLRGCADSLAPGGAGSQAH